ncbi:MAG: prolyl oligopeptidase family serine peptidase [Clostridia bacterium]
MKKWMFCLSAVAMCLCTLAACSDVQPTAAESVLTEEAAETAVPALKPTPSEEPVPAEKDYARLITYIPADVDMDTAVRVENRNCKHIQAMKVLFDEDSYMAYIKAVTKLKKTPSEETLTAALVAREALAEVDTVANRLWFIWDGSTMPVAGGESYTEEDLDKSQMFGYGYEPFLIKYLVADQSVCKGNIIAVSGGAMLVWANGSEGYPAAKVFNDLDYNYFLLQRRVGPYSNEDIFMDYQRAVRVVKYHAALENYGGQDMYAALGWSGGGFTIMGAVNYLYGSLTPTVYDTAYIPDEIDQTISADLDVAMPIYGGSLDDASANPNLPAFFIVHGSADETIDPQSSINLYNKVKDIVPAELTIIEDAGHGFGVGLAPATGQAPGTELWPAQADVFMQANLNFQKNTYHSRVEPILFPEVPEEFTKVKSFYGYYILEDSDVLFAVNDGLTRFCVKFNAIGGSRETVITGNIVDGQTVADPGTNGLFGEDIQLMYEDALVDSQPWAPIVRN